MPLGEWTVYNPSQSLDKGLARANLKFEQNIATEKLGMARETLDFNKSKLTSSLASEAATLQRQKERDFNADQKHKEDTLTAITERHKDAVLNSYDPEAPEDAKWNQLFQGSEAVLTEMYETKNAKGERMFTDEEITNVDKAIGANLNPQAFEDKFIDKDKDNKTAAQRDYEYGLENPDFVKSQSAADKEYAPSDISKKLNERQALIDKGFAEDSPEIRAYDSALHGTDFGAEVMTDEEVDALASSIYYGMRMPPFGRGKEATKNRTKVIKALANYGRTGGVSGREPEKGTAKRTPMEAGLDILTQSSETKAIQGSMNMLDKQINSMESFARNIDLQVERVKTKTKGLKTYDTRLLNMPLRLFRGKVKGSPEQAIYDMYITEVEAEIGKIATGSTQSIAELSTSAQEKWAKIHDKNLSWNDMVKLLDESSHAAKMRVSSVKAQQQVAKERMSRNIDGDTEKMQTVSAKADFDKLPSGTEYIDARDGKKYRKP